MKLIKGAIWILVACMATACAEENQWDCFTGMGEVKTEVRTLPPFDALYTQDRIDLDYRHDTTYRAEVRFGENLLDHIRTTVVDGELRLENVATCNWVRDLSIKPKVTLYAPGFGRLENRGNGQIRFLDTLRTDAFQYEAYESNGSADLLLATSEAAVLLHTGRCNVEVKGRTELAQLYNAGAGRIHAQHLLSPNTLVNNSSFQDMEVYSSGYLFVTIFRQGGVCYAGEPDMVELEIMGSGTASPCGGN